MKNRIKFIYENYEGVFAFSLFPAVILERYNYAKSNKFQFTLAFLFWRLEITIYKNR